MKFPDTVFMYSIEFRGDQQGPIEGAMQGRRTHMAINAGICGSALAHEAGCTSIEPMRLENPHS
jgi:hypothetical protein